MWRIGVTNLGLFREGKHLEEDNLWRATGVCVEPLAAQRGESRAVFTGSKTQSPSWMRQNRFLGGRENEPRLRLAQRQAPLRSSAPMPETRTPVAPTFLGWLQQAQCLLDMHLQQKTAAAPPSRRASSLRPSSTLPQHRARDSCSGMIS